MESVPMVQMPRYRCHKEVWALKIGEGTITALPDGSVVLPIADGGYAPVIASKEMVERYFPQAGDYVVVYQDGYRSISPAKAFEDGYSRI